MTRRSAVPIALAAALWLLAAVVAAPARAADDVGLSPDGAVWYDELHRPLFDPALRWVPGDAEVASFYVRNDGPSAALLTIEVRGVDGEDLMAADDVEVAARVADGGWAAIENRTPSRRLTDRAIAEGGQIRVDVRVRFSWDASNDTMLGRLPIDFEVRLVEDHPAGGADREDGADGGPGGWLPDTGSAVSWIVVWLGATLVGCGLALVAAARRRRTDERDDEPADEPADEPVAAERPETVDAGVVVDG